MELTHIFNVASIVKRLKKKTTEPNLYEKVNQIFKGASTGTPALRAEVVDILRKQVDAYVQMIEDPSAPIPE